MEKLFIASHYSPVRKMGRVISGGWVGSSAVNETGQRWMSTAAGQVQLGTPFWMSSLVGRSKEIRIDITGSNHNFRTQDMHQWMLNAAGGAWPADAVWRIAVHPGVQLVCHAADDNCMWFGGGINGRVIIENHGHILGRGGVGGQGYSGALNGQAGGCAIYRESKIVLDVYNYGVIAGGGGGGGGCSHTSVGDTIGAGGGAPFGGGGAAEYHGGSAGYDTPGGPGAYKAGSGGYWGNAGQNAPGPGNEYGYGGGAGYAFGGGGPINWYNQGDVRGPIA